LRWDSTRIIDTPERLELPLRVLSGSGGLPPRPGYPTTGDLLPGQLPVQVEVTPRRLQQFQLAPGETVHWSFGDQHGSVTTDPTGAATVPLRLDITWQTLVMTRN